MAKNKPESTQDTSKPVSLRDDSPHTPATPPEGTSTRTVMVLMASAVVVLIVLLILVVLSGSNDDSVTSDELRDVVEEVVSTQLAAAQPVAAGPEGAIDQAALQEMVNNSVGTEVAALVPTNTPIPPTPTLIALTDYADEDAFLGPDDAPVVMVEFSDFQCGFCGRFYDETLPLILENFPNEVKFIYRDFPIFGEDSIRAAMAAECAEEQGQFWEMHNRIFDIHAASQQVALSDETLISFASELDLDTDAFSECLTSQRYLDEVRADFQDAEAWGLRGTPGYVINGVVYTIGAQPFEVFEGIINDELTRLNAES